ncbi:ABC transporter permease [Xanthobacteraceae bacterium Astr-EGSB]|uniref:ABC transporter permease n=1 Tax=Astrobacterium formosum TaxID=3069710 RepID=UPI0027B51B92|nr:ABC transporter permease [Xanthobacteraceae bacterium Astr-EGSB]
MALFLTKRFLQALFVVFAVTLLVAWAVRLSGDPAIMLTGGAGSVTEQDLVNIRNALGLNRPFHEQYLGFLYGLLHGDLGNSFVGGTPVTQLVAKALPATLMLAAAAIFVSIALAVPLGIRAAIKRGSAEDQAIRIASLAGLSFPNFWLALMMVLVFSILLKWLPPSGFDGPVSLILPAVTAGVINTAANVRLVRTSMLETLSAQYIMVARAKGLAERVVLYKHALRNSAIPLVTYVGIQFGNLVAGLVVIERVFNWPGMGSLAFDAVAGRDYPVLQGVVTVFAILIVSVNLLIDILYGLLDPRIRTE